MKKIMVLGSLLAATVATSGLALVGGALAQPNTQPNSAYGCPGMTGPGRMGPGMMNNGAMGPGMMGPGMMHNGVAGRGGTGAQANLNLSGDDVRSALERWLAMGGNPRLKVGTVAEKDAGTVVADIVTSEKDVLVQRFAVDRKTGVYQSIQ